MKILELLLAFFALGVQGDPEPEPQPEPEPDQPELDLDPADPEPEPQDEPGVASREELEAARRETKEAKEAAERYQRELNEARAARPAPRIDDEAAKEDARLNDPNTPALEKWQIQANRELRAGRNAAQTALMQAEDVRDQTSFSQLAVTEPALHKRYAAKVEEELTKARSQGYFAVKREYIYNQLIARDMRDGKFKKKAAPAAGAEKVVNRGKLPGVKSDVSGRGATSERDKRRARLENVQI